MIYNIIQSNSTGNCVIYDKSVMVDVGVTWSKIKDYMDGVKIILMTHEHGDHLNKIAVRKIVVNYPKIRWVAHRGLAKKLEKLGVENYYFPLKHNYTKINGVNICALGLYHDVENLGYRILIGDKKILHATDTAHLKGIEAKGYDYYMLECNHITSWAVNLIDEAKENGEFCHYAQSMNSHLSVEQSVEFFKENRGENSKLVPLHMSDKMKENILKYIELEVNND